MLQPASPTFFQRSALALAPALLGQWLVHRLEGAPPRVGRIVETEAYVGPHDKAAHSSKGRTPRTEVMYRAPGHAYVFLVYGMHHCFNVVTGNGSAVLVRALEPVMGVPRAVRTDGPGKLTKALGLTLLQNGLYLPTASLFIAERTVVEHQHIASGPRIGIDYAQEWVNKPYRFWLRDNPFVSVAKASGAHPPRRRVPG
ncbi:MAG: DNA-3-methyladenine glycosylase [Myxococcaceae bacterium]|nr:DNA-3-methyladenine glycosylase [Myxococcaceae bacterium]